MWDLKYTFHLIFLPFSLLPQTMMEYSIPNYSLLTMVPSGETISVLNSLAVIAKAWGKGSSKVCGSITLEN